MDIYGICPACGQETKLSNKNANYCMCSSCYEIYSIMNDAKINGVRLNSTEKSNILDDIERDANQKVSNWRCI